MTGVAALSERMVMSTLRDDLPFAILAPVGLFTVFDLALRNVIDTGGMSYSQYLLPTVVVQTAFLGALTTLDRAARDQRSGFGIRLGTLPISAHAPLVARMLYCLLRGALAMLSALAIAYLFGFRFSGGPLAAAGFVLLTLFFTLALSLAADGIGTALAHTAVAESGAASQLLLIPQLLLIVVSTGLAPVEAFPEWIRGFVRYQPVSVVTDTLRGLSTGRLPWNELMLSLVWTVGLLVLCGVLAARMQRRAR